MNIVFDLGGVVVTWDPQAIIAHVFSDPADQARVRREIFGHADWLELDRGTLDRQEAIARAVQRTALPEAKVTAMLRHVPHALVAMPESVDLLYRMKAQGHALYCLSNMHAASIEHLEKTYDFWKVFTGIVISCRARLCKPEPAIYAHLLEKNGLRAGDTVFIDDTEENLAAAARFGMRTIKFENRAQCERELQALAGVAAGR